MASLKELLALAKSQAGYQEKASNACLDDFHENAGYQNYTKYSRDVDNWGLEGCQGQPWCATYQFWLEAKTFGVDAALGHFHMDREHYQAYNCACIYRAFQSAGCVSGSPQAGALVIFQDYRHVGRVTEIKDGRVYTNEGNTSALYGDSNGGTVREKNYILTDPNILGYCIINYGEDNGETDTEKGFLPEGTIQAKSQTESYQRWLNTWYSSLLTTYMGEPLEEDGSFGPKTRQGSLLVWKDILNRLYGKRLSLEGNTFDASCREAAGAALTSYGSSGTLTAIAEGILASKGFYSGNIDAEFGPGMEQAVRKFQNSRGLIVAGVVGADTWAELFQ